MQGMYKRLLTAAINGKERPYTLFHQTPRCPALIKWSSSAAL